MKKNRIAIGFVGLALAATSLTACMDKANEPFKDAPRDGTDNGPAQIVEMPDGFSNLATKCLTDASGNRTGVRITVAYHGDSKYGSVSQILDPSCK